MSRNPQPSVEEVERFQRTDRTYRRICRRADRMTELQRGLLYERLQRYPSDYEQFLPTAFGNAIRRIERYGPARFRLDQQVLWYELTASAPADATKAVNQARSAVDFFVCLLSGHLLVIVTALAATPVDHGGARRLELGVLVAGGLVALWYRSALVGTDNWAAAVRALINLGRRPLAEAMNLSLPERIVEEREMWHQVVALVTGPYLSDTARLDRYRVTKPRSRRRIPLGGDRPPT